jgi:uncharacterized membrane protein
MDSYHSVLLAAQPARGALFALTMRVSTPTQRPTTMYAKLALAATLLSAAADAQIVNNGDFSADTIPTSPGYVYMNPAGWEESTGGIVVVVNGNGPWGGLDSQGGTHFISIQGSGATLQQTLTGLTPGTTYAVRFLVTHRPGYGNDETIHVNIDGNPIWETNHPEDGFQEVAATFTASAASHTLAFANDSPGGDKSVFVDEVVVEALAGANIPAGGTALGQAYWGQPLVADTRIEQVNIPLDYEIGIDITPGATIVGDWAAIVHFTATDTNCCEYGSRIPGVWFWPGTRKILVVDGHGANGNSHTGEWGCNDDLLTLTEGETATLRMVMAESIVSIYVNGELACDEPRADRQVYPSVAAYLADPWYVAADVTVDNLYIIGGAVTDPPPPPPPPPPPITTAIPQGAQMLGGDGQLIAGTQLNDVTIPLDYQIGVTITPGATIVGDWAAIVHFTATDTNCCEYGSRIPGIWFWPGTRKILVVDGHGANGNSHTGEWGCDENLLTLDQGVAATLTMVMEAASVSIYVNGEWACAVPRADRDVWPNTKVYAADPWYEAADASISDLYLYDPGNDGRAGGDCVTAMVTAGAATETPGEEVGGQWTTGSDSNGGYMTQGGTGNFLRWDNELGTSDFTSRMSIKLMNLDGSAATFEFNRNSHFGFEGSCQCVFAEGDFYGSFQNIGAPADFGITEGNMLDFIVQRRGETFTIYVNGQVVQTHTSSAPITSLGLRPHRATMQLYDWTVSKDSGCASGANQGSVVANGDFSLDTIPTSPGYVYMNPAGWEESTGGIVVVVNGNGPWGGLDSQGGTHFISIQGSGATLQQTLTGLTPGTNYQVGFLLTHRPGYGNDETVSVNIDGSPIFVTAHPEDAFTPTTADFTATSDTHVLAFVNDSPGGDKSVFVDEVTVSSTVGQPTGSGSPGDLDGDGNVDVADLLLLLASFGTSSAGDCNGDGVTDVADLLILLSNFGN